jgi:hypothetical protein
MHLFPCGRPAEDPANQWQATVPVLVVVAAPAAEQVDGFLTQLNSFWLNSFPGFYLDITRIYTNTPQPRIEYWPALVRQDELKHQVHADDGTAWDIPPPPCTEPFAGQPSGHRTAPGTLDAFGPTVRRPLGDLVHARVGDKASNADLGVWVSEDAAYPWLAAYLTTDRLRVLLATPASMTIERYELPNLRGLCFVLRDYLAPSSSSGLSPDQLGKSLGEFLRARHADLPVSLLPEPPAPEPRRLPWPRGTPRGGGTGRSTGHRYVRTARPHRPGPRSARAWERECGR